VGGTDREKSYANSMETMTLVLDKHSKRPVLSVKAQQLVRFLLQENDRLQGLLAQKKPPSRKEMEEEGTRARHACRMLATEIADHILQPEGYNLIWESRKHQQTLAAMRVIEDVFYNIKLLPRTEAKENPDPSQPGPKSNSKQDPGSVLKIIT
jgi:hypothetical protein